MADSYSILSFTDFRGGLSPEANRGPRGAFYGGYGIDFRTGDNTLKCNQALKKDTGTLVTDLVLTGFRGSNGYQYAFGDSGKIYCKYGGSWSLAYTDPDGKITGAAEFTHNDGAGNHIPYIVWATQTKVKKIKLADASGTWSALNIVNVGTFSVGSASYPHTMRVASGSLMITDSNWLAELDYEAAFNNQALNIAAGNNGKTLHERNDAVVIGTEGGSTPDGWVFTWDGFQDSWILKRPAQGSSVNAMLPLEGGMLLQAGNEGYLRFWNYADVSPLTRVTNQGSACTFAYPGAAAEYNTLPHIGMNGGDRNGVYSIGRFNKNDVVALNLEYIPSHGKLTGTEIGAIWKDGTDLYVSWKDGSTYGIDIIDHTTKAAARWESLENDAKRPDAEKVVRLLKLVAKTAIPTGCSVKPWIKATRDDDWVEIDTEEGDTTMAEGATKAIFNAENMGEVFAVALDLTPSGNTTPEVAAALAFFDMDNEL